MAVNKVVFNTGDGERTLIDLTNDTVTPETLMTGATAHDASGEQIVGRATSGGAQADWNAAEGQPGHVLNRTHWVDISRTELLATSTIHSSVGNGQVLGTPLGITPGKNYIVNWEGVEYKCKAFTTDIYGYELRAIGDASRHFGNAPATGEPFGIWEIDEATATEMGTPNWRVFIRPNDTTTRNFTVSIDEETETVHKLDGKYLPDGVPYLGRIETVVLPETQIDFVGGNKYQSVIYTPFNVTIGETYIVNLNGKEYKCNCMDAKGYDESYSGIPGLLPEGVNLSTGEGLEFGVLCFPEALEGVVYGIAFFVNEQESGTISIYQVDETSHKLDPKLLPDGVPYVEETVLLEEAEAVSFTHPAFGTMWGIYQGIPNLKAGETYTITYNGTPYKCVCQPAPAGLIEDPNAVAMGNFYVVGGANTGEPFAMLVSYMYQEVDVIDLTGASAVKVKIHTATAANETYLSSPNGTIFKITISDSGALSATAI